MKKIILILLILILLLTSSLLISCGGGCEYCHYTGRVPCYDCYGTAEIACKFCGGTGKQPCSNYSCRYRLYYICNDCNGLGYKYEYAPSINDYYYTRCYCSIPHSYCIYDDMCWCIDGSENCTSCSNGFLDCPTC